MLSRDSPEPSRRSGIALSWSRRSGFALNCPHIVKAGHKRFMSIPAVVQLALPSATKPAPKHQVLPACRHSGQPAIEFLERPFMYFSIPIHRPRWSPVDHLLVLQRPFQVEVALISRVFRSSDRNLLSDCISPSAITDTSSGNGEVASCARLRLFSHAPPHQKCAERVSHRWQKKKRRETRFPNRQRASTLEFGSVFSLWNRRPSWGL